jgi:hypothetical protein
VLPEWRTASGSHRERTSALGRYAFGLLQGAVFIQIAVWTRGAGQEFERVAATTGADIEHLMAGLEQLRRAYGLMRVTIVLALALVALALAASLLLSSLPTTG